MSELITVGFSTREHNPEFIEYLKKSSGFKKIIVIEKINNGEKSLSQVYNEILKECKTDVCVLCHDDIYFDSTSWYSKIVKHFEKNDFGILGVAGTTSLTDSGRWWDEKNKMVGIVNHEHQGRKWESRYSESFENNICETLMVDGLFIAVHKKRIKSDFDESFEGFHFYDYSFSFSNHLKGCKVGVITNIRVTHKSIGMTNNEWEKNRLQFVEKYKSNLPIKLPFDDKRKIKVLISSLSFKTFTGSELYVYELAKNLIKKNCDVTVLSNIGGPLTDMAKRDGIKCVSFDNPPGYKMGDGVWGLNTEKGYELSRPNIFYKIQDVNFDVIHIQHKPVAERIIQMYPQIPKIYTIHSEVISLEEPITDNSIKKYIAIRPEIKDYLINNFQIDESLIEIIYNPIDDSKFKFEKVINKNYTLFVGTVDYLREKSIRDLVNTCSTENRELWIVGENKSNYLSELLENKNVKYFPSTWNVEKFVKECKETSGIQLGRTTIEGWMSGKSGWIYKVDSEGNIIEKTYHTPPNDLEKYFSSNVTDLIKEQYKSII